MDIVNIIIIAVIAFFALIGLITGLVKGFSRVKSWAVELVLTGGISIAVSGLISKNLGSGIVSAGITLGVTVALICIFMLLFAIFRSSMKKHIAKRKELSYYEQYDEMEDNTEKILCALGTEDKKTYKKLTKRKFKQSGGGWSAVDKIFGGLTLAVKGAVITGFLVAVVLVVIDFSRLASDGGQLSGMLNGLYSDNIWLFFKNYIFDFLIIGIIMLCIKSGFSSGISSSLWSLIVLALVAGAAVLSFSLSFNGAEFASAAEGLAGKLEGMLGGAAEFLDGVGITPLKIAQAIIGLGLFVLMLIAVILIAIFVPKLIDKARDSVVFRGIDGVFGAIVLTAIIVGVLLAVGAVVSSIYELEFMQVFNAYFEKSGIATYFYDQNVLAQMGILTNLPLKDWLS